MPYGVDDAVWEAARDEIRQILIACAKRKGNETIAYSDLVSQVQSLDLQARDERLNHLLGEISRAEAAAGRGMLSVLVVHKHGDMQPGPGFFELAKQLGRKTQDIEACWIAEFNHVCQAWT